MWQLLSVRGSRTSGGSIHRDDLKIPKQKVCGRHLKPFSLGRSGRSGSSASPRCRPCSTRCRASSASRSAPSSSRALVRIQNLGFMVEQARYQRMESVKRRMTAAKAPHQCSASAICCWIRRFVGSCPALADSAVQQLGASWAPLGAKLCRPPRSAAPVVAVGLEDGAAPALHQLAGHAAVGRQLVRQLGQEHDDVAQLALLQLLLHGCRV